jgi:hypothetical protein
VVPDSVRKALFADSQFFNGQGHQVLVALAALRDRVHHIKAGPENSAVVRIPQALHVPVAIRHAREWEEWAQADRRQREDPHVQAARHAVPASLIFRGKKKAR